MRLAAPRLVARPATLADAAAIARVYNAGIAERIATFETRPRSAGDVAAWFDGRHPIVCVELDGGIAGYAATFDYRPRDCYAGVAEFSVYVYPEARGRGVGRAAMEALVAAAQEAGFWKLVSRVFPENVASLALLRSVGFREVGVYRRHGKLDGAWRDCVIVERLIGDAARDLPDMQKRRPGEAPLLRRSRRGGGEGASRP